MHKASTQIIVIPIGDWDEVFIDQRRSGYVTAELRVGKLSFLTASVDQNGKT